MPLPPAIQQFGIDAAKFLAGVDEMIAGVDRLAKSIDAAVASADRLSGMADAAAGAADRFAAAEQAADERTATLAGGLDLLSKQLDQVIAATDQTTVAVDRLAESEARAGEAAAAAGDEQAASGKKAAAFGGVLKTALLGVGIAAVYGIDKAAGFQAQITQLHTQAGVAASQLPALSKGILQLSAQVGFGPDSLAESLYHVASNMESLGATSPQMLNMVAVAAKGAQVGGADLVDVTNALTSAVASGIPGVSSYTQAMGALNAIVGSGDMHMQDLANSFSTGLLPVMKQYGLSLNDVGAALATFGDLNIRGQQAATDLRMAVQSMNVPSKQGIADFKAMGMAAGQLGADIREHGLLFALQDLQKHYAAMGITGTKVGQQLTADFTKKAGVGLAVLLGNMDRLRSKYPAITKAADDFAGAWADRQKTMAQQWDDLKAGAQSLAISFGTILLPAATKVVGMLARFAGYLEQHGALAAFAGALLAVAVGFKIAATAESIFNQVSDMNPVMRVIMLVIALAGTLYFLYNRYKVVRDIVADVAKFFTGAWQDAVKAAGAVANWFAGVWQDASQAAGASASWFAGAWHDALHGVGDVVHWFQGVWRDVMTAVGAVVNWFVTGPLAFIKQQVAVFSQFWAQHSAEIEEIARFAWNVIRDVVTTTFGIILAVLRAGLAVLEAVWSVAWSIISGIARTAWAVIRDVVVTTWHVILDFLKPALVILQAIWKTTWDLIRNYVKMAWDTIAAVISTAIKIVLDIISVALDLLTGHWSKAWADVKKLVGDAIHGIGQILYTWGKTAITLLYQAGKDIVTGLIHGIESMATGAWHAITSVASGIYHHALSFLGISSPSVLFAGIGENIDLGLAQGIYAQQQAVEAAISTVANSAISIANQALTSIANMFNGTTSMTNFAEGARANLAFRPGVIPGVSVPGGGGGGGGGDGGGGGGGGSLPGLGGTGGSGTGSSSKASSPSATYYQLGAQITQGLALGIAQTIGQAVAEARKLSAAVKHAFLAGQITQSQEESYLEKIANAVAARREKIIKVMQEIGLKMRAGILSGLEDAATASQAKSAVDKLIAFVQQAWSAGAITLRRATFMTGWLEKDNTRLEALAARRQQLNATIKAADAYAASTTANAEQWGGLSNVASSMTAGGMVYSGNLLAGMRANLAQIRQFDQAIRRLAKLGLRKDLLNQIIQMGPAQGLQVAEALINGPASVLHQMNATQAQLVSASTQLGQQAANAMYDTGKAAGKGFLSGLQAQEKQVTQMMDRIARTMVATMRRELGIGGGHGGGSTVTVNVHGFIGNNHELAQEIYNMLQAEALRHTRRNGNNGFNL